MYAFVSCKKELTKLHHVSNEVLLFFFLYFKNIYKYFFFCFVFKQIQNVCVIKQNGGLLCAEFTLKFYFTNNILFKHIWKNPLFSFLSFVFFCFCKILGFSICVLLYSSHNFFKKTGLFAKENIGIFNHRPSFQF